MPESLTHSLSTHVKGWCCLGGWDPVGRVKPHSRSVGVTARGRDTDNPAKATGEFLRSRSGREMDGRGWGETRADVSQEVLEPERQEGADRAKSTTRCLSLCQRHRGLSDATRACPCAGGGGALPTGARAGL